MPTILIVENQRLLKEILSQELRREGYSVIGVDNVEDFQESLDDTKPDLVLLDLYSLQSEGWEVLRYAKGKDPYLPVLLISPFPNVYLVESSIQVKEFKKKIASVLKKEAATNPRWRDTDGEYPAFASAQHGKPSKRIR
jgi:DNA-binding NtrC family response regulator